MFGMSLAEIGIVMLVALVVIGPERLPEFARTVGKTLGDIRRAGNQLRDAIMFEAEQEEQQRKLAELEKQPTALGSEPHDTSPAQSTSHAHALPPGESSQEGVEYYHDPHEYDEFDQMGPIDQWEDDDDFFTLGHVHAPAHHEIPLPALADVVAGHEIPLPATGGAQDARVVELTARLEVR